MDIDLTKDPQWPDGTPAGSFADILDSPRTIEAMKTVGILAEELDHVTVD